MRDLQTIITYLQTQDISVEPTRVLPSFVDYTNTLDHRNVAWSTIAVQTKEPIVLDDSLVESMSLASMAAVHMLNLKEGETLLDMCAAPGMKSLYASKLASVSLYANDLSRDRVLRMNRLFNKHAVTASVSVQDGQRLFTDIDQLQFDRILLDAPCSGEGVILGGNEKLLATWSPAKVKRLQQLQIKLVKHAWALLKPGGRLVYATCTLNKNENERVLKKAIKANVTTICTPLSLSELPMLGNNQAWRVLPSENAIGFFVAVLDKPTKDDYDAANE